MNKCELCGVATSVRAEINTSEGKLMVCTECYEREQSGELELMIPKKPRYIRFYNIQLAKTGTYKESDEPRYIFSIPRKRKGDFDFEKSYDVVFIKR